MFNNCTWILSFWNNFVRFLDVSCLFIVRHPCLICYVLFKKKKHNSKKRRDWNIEHLNCIMNLRYNCNCTSYLHKIFVTCVHTNRVLISRIVCFSNVPDIACNYHYWGCIRRREFSHSATVKHWHVFISIWIILYHCDWKKIQNVIN